MSEYSEYFFYGAGIGLLFVLSMEFLLLYKQLQVRVSDIDNASVDVSSIVLRTAEVISHVQSERRWVLTHVVRMNACKQALKRAASTAGRSRASGNLRSLSQKNRKWR